MPPNILVFFADQMRADTLGCAGHPLVKTPHLDDLAESGVIFRNAYTPDPICVPARAAFTTGKYPHRCTGSKNNSGRIRDGQPKIAETLGWNGYITYSSGKLHYDPYSPPGEPRLLHGFQHCSLAESGRILKTFDPKGETPGLEDYHDYLKEAGWSGYERAHGVGNNDIHPAPSPLPREHYVDGWVADRAIEYLDFHEKKHRDSPFFLFVSFPKPHAPYDPPRPYDAMYDPRAVPPPLTRRDDSKMIPTKIHERITHGWDIFSPETVQLTRAYYYGQVSYQDQQVGRVLSALGETGRREDTIVIYTADHGDMLGDFGFFAKSCFYNGSVRVPLIVSGTGKHESDALVGLQDILPTVAALTGIDIDEELDGRSLAPVLRGEPFEERDVFVSTCFDDPRQLFMAADKRFRYSYSQMGGIEELYDLENDPDELTDLVKEPACRDVLENLRTRLIRWLEEMEDASALRDGRLRICDDDILESAKFEPGTMGWRWY